MASLGWQTVSNHTVELLPNLVCLLQQAKVTLRSLEAIIVATGPGSYNGLRVGISTAKGLAFKLRIPLLGISTLEAEAYPFGFTRFPLRPIHSAGREEIATALYRQEDTGWRCLETPNVTTVEALCRRTRRKTLFCGEIPAHVMAYLQDGLGRKAVISYCNSPFRGSALAVLGWRKLSVGERDDPITLQPLYLLPPHITKPRVRVPNKQSRSEEERSDDGSS